MRVRVAEERARGEVASRIRRVRWFRWKRLLGGRLVERAEVGGDLFLRERREARLPTASAQVSATARLVFIFMVVFRSFVFIVVVFIAVSLSVVDSFGCLTFYSTNARGSEEVLSAGGFHR